MLIVTHWFSTSVSLVKFANAGNKICKSNSTAGAVQVETNLQEQLSHHLLLENNYVAKIHGT